MQKQTIATLVSSFIFCACGSSSSDPKNQSKADTDNKATTEQIVTSNLIIDESKLSGVWWSDKEQNAPHASFTINDSTISYPDQEEQSEFKYKVKGDSLVVFFDGFNTTSHIDKLTASTLELTTDGEKSTFRKSEK